MKTVIVSTIDDVLVLLVLRGKKLPWTSGVVAVFTPLRVEVNSK